MDEGIVAGFEYADEAIPDGVLDSLEGKRNLSLQDFSLDAKDLRVSGRKKTYLNELDVIVAGVSLAGYDANIKVCLGKKPGMRTQDDLDTTENGRVGIVQEGNSLRP